jgi:hypothetical protein
MVASDWCRPRSPRRNRAVGTAPCRHGPGRFPGYRLWVAQARHGGEPFGDATAAAHRAGHPACPLLPQLDLVNEVGQVRTSSDDRRSLEHLPGHIAAPSSPPRPGPDPSAQPATSPSRSARPRRCRAAPRLRPPRPAGPGPSARPAVPARRAVMIRSGSGLARFTAMPRTVGAAYDRPDPGRDDQGFGALPGPSLTHSRWRCLSASARSDRGEELAIGRRSGWLGWWSGPAAMQVTAWRLVRLLVVFAVLGGLSPL